MSASCATSAQREDGCHFPPCAMHGTTRTRVPADALRDVDAIVNLAGEPVADTRWTVAKKALIHDSRIQGTQRLVAGSAGRTAPGVTAFVHGSASGYYGDRGDELLTAASTRGVRIPGGSCAGLGG